MSDVFTQGGTARSEIYHELASLRLTDPHTHIDPHAPASTTLADLLGYHYYTELAHSAGMPKSQIEDPAIGPKELVERLVGGLAPLENTVQYSWLIEICKMFFGFDEDRLHVNNWEALYDRSESIMSSAEWPDMVLDQSNIEAVFLTNDFDDDLAGFDTDRYIPCLRTDDLVFHLSDPVVQERLAKCTGVSLDGTLSSLRASLRALFVHFVARGARACAISLPPSFTPTAVADGRATTALDAVLRGGITADASHKEALSRRVFWTLAELCDEFGLPFDLMIGVNRKVYPGGVFQGQDLYDSRVSLIQYRDLFNTFSDVKFPVSVLASVTNQELVSYAWIFPNVIPNGHWWYSNTPSTIAHDLAARLEAVPQNKMIGYYSDAYKLEFVWPKFNMYRKVLAGVLADEFVRDRGWSVERAVEFGRRVLKDNTEEIFSRRAADPIASGENATEAGAGDPLETDLLGGIATSATGAVSAATGVGLGVGAVAATGAATLASALASALASESVDPSPSTAELAEIELQDPLKTLDDDPSEDVPTLDEDDSDVMFVDEAELETYDTVVVEPNDLAAAIVEESVAEPSADADAKSNTEEDLGQPGDESFDHATSDFAEDAAVTIIEEPSPADVTGALEELETPELEIPELDIPEREMPELDIPDRELPAAEFAETEPSDPHATQSLDFSAEPEPLTEPLTEPSTAELPAMEESAFDPLPMDDEIGELDLDDVEFLDPADDSVHDAASIGLILDDEPLDLGDLTGDSETPATAPAPATASEPAIEFLDTDDDDEIPEIRQLRGETSFAPDDESLQLQSDPQTGELRFGASEPAPDLSIDSEPATPADSNNNDDEFDRNGLEDDETDPASTN